jgi:hypothetical protein
LINHLKASRELAHPLAIEAKLRGSKSEKNLAIRAFPKAKLDREPEVKAGDLKGFAKAKRIHGSKICWRDPTGSFALLRMTKKGAPGMPGAPWKFLRRVFETSARGG